MQSVLCMHCAIELLELHLPAPMRFTTGWCSVRERGMARCPICRKNSVPAAQLSPANGFALNHNVLEIMDVLGVSAHCRCVCVCTRAEGGGCVPFAELHAAHCCGTNHVLLVCWAS